MPSQRKQSEGTVLENLMMAIVNGWLVPMDNTKIDTNPSHGT